MKEKKIKILNLVLENVPFEGWNDSTFFAAVEKLGFSEEIENIFPFRIKDLENFYFELADEDLKSKLENTNFEESSIRDIVKIALMFRFKYYDQHKESLRIIAGRNMLRGLPINNISKIYNLTNIIWYSAGDKSVDYNYYTKRLLLAGVYISSFLFWLDESDEEKLSEFIDRRISNVMQIQKIKSKLFEKNNVNLLKNLIPFNDRAIINRIKNFTR